MGRSRGGGRSRSPPPRRASPPPPAARPAPPPPAPQQQRQGGLGGGLGSMLAQGMALGVGSSMAHRAVDAVLGSRYPAPLEATQAAAQVAATADEPCAPRAKSFVACMTDETNSGDLEACRYYLDSLQACRRQQQTAGGGGGGGGGFGSEMH